MWHSFTSSQHSIINLLFTDLLWSNASAQTVSFISTLAFCKKPLHVEWLSVFQRRPALGRDPALHSWSWGWSRARLTLRTLPLSWTPRSYRHPSNAEIFKRTSTAHCPSISWFWRWTCSVRHVGSFFFLYFLLSFFLNIWLLLHVSALRNDFHKRVLADWV